MGLLSACSGEATSQSTNTPSPQFVTHMAYPTLTPIPPTPTLTPEPLAAKVNGEEITLSEYQAELARFHSANPTFSGNAQTIVLDDLIAQVLLAQGAREAGFVMDNATLDEQMAHLIQTSGGEKAFSDWLTTNYYTMESFRLALQRSLASAWMRDKIASSVPQEAEQVHALQILLPNMDQAIEVVAQLESGKDFATLALTYDPISMGDLGWFPRGYLVDSKLEEAAFSLQPGEISDIIETSLGYHILQVVERDPKRPLDPDARLALQQIALTNWLEQRRAQSNIVIFLP